MSQAKKRKKKEERKGTDIEKLLWCKEITTRSLMMGSCANQALKVQSTLLDTIQKAVAFREQNGEWEEQALMSRGTQGGLIT